MDKRPLFLGRGRGRGGPAQQNCTNNAIAATWRSRTVQSGARNSVLEASEERLKKANKIKESVKKYLETTGDQFEESSEDEEINDDEILTKTLKSYRSTQQGTEDDLHKTTEYLKDYCRPGASICLICIASIKHVDAVWNCNQCFAVLHLQCIQKWARDGAAYTFLINVDDAHPTGSSWFCPKCRHGFIQSECPTKYFCYCGKQENPSFDPWLAPHSCGQSCNRALKPECGHVCLLLCHPGPCPPCPKTVHVSCHCGSQPPEVKRCSAKAWSCGKPCRKRLTCAHHDCESPCHSGDCPSCPKESVQSCLCGKVKSKRPCASPEWQCEQICNKVLSCGHHTCEKLCHSGICGDCPRTGDRKCPCGKTTVSLPCTEDIPPCGDTCDKLLSCGRHHCTQQCHTGQCGVCRHVVERTCRCGKRKKKIPCSQEFLCEIKCPQMRQCERHPCKRKCCDGNCPPCEQTCNRTLNCRNHKCPSQCHKGPCYPCPLQVDVKCFCGSTVLTLPCGREKVTKPPKCSEPCRHPPDCHHPKRKRHLCHYGSCPPCKQTCGLTLPCGHLCPVSCHDGIRPDQAKLNITKLTVNGKLLSTAPESQSSEPVTSAPCPPCRFPVKRSCFGEHEVCSFPCSGAKPFSCGRPCGRHLPCHNHICQLECHVVTNAADGLQAGEECQVCEEPCSKPRPPGCTHDCLLPCHQGDCPLCKQLVKVQCHCSLMSVYVQCSDLTSSDETRRNELLSCKNQCPKNLGCGHRCSTPCHAGPCPTPERCRKKAPVRCPCLRKKKDFPCHLVQTGKASLECDEDCTSLKDNKKKLTTKEEEMKKQEELKAQQEELEWFERKQRGKRRRPRKQHQEVIEPAWWRRHLITVVMLSTAVGLVSGLFYIALH